MVPRSRLLILGTLASVLMALGCKTETPVTPTGEDTGRITRASKAPSRGGAFKGTVNFGGSLTPDKATVSVVDEKLQLITFAGKAKPDSAGKFALKPAPTRVYFVLVEGEKQKMLGAVLPVESKDPNEEPSIVVNAASTLAVAGVMGAFDPARGGQYQLEDMPVDLFGKLVDAIAVTNPQLDLTKDPRDHGGQFTKLYESNAAVKKAYDDLFAELRARFEKRNPGLPLPTTSLPPAETTPNPNATATGGSGLASIAPSPLPSGVVASASASTGASATPSTAASSSADASAAPSVAPRTFDPLKHTMGTVTGNTLDGQPIAVDGNFHHFSAKMTTAQAGVELMAIPDGNRILLADSLQEKYIFADLTTLLKAQPSDAAVDVSNVVGAAADGQTLYAVGTVGGTRSLIKMTVAFAFTSNPPFSVTATHMPLTGDEIPSAAHGHAFAGGSLYVSSSSQHRIFKIDVATGATTRYSGEEQAGSPLIAETAVAAARYNTPGGLLAVGDFIYVSEVESHRLLRIKLSTGMVTPFSGANTTAEMKSGTIEEARFLRPNALFPDNEGRFLVADRTNGTVRRVNPDADPTKAEVLHYVVVDASGANPNPKFLQFFQGVAKCGANTFAIDTEGKLRQLTPKP